MLRSSSMDTIVIVMPTYNESSCISEMIETLMKVTFPEVQADMHLLIVDDSSPDGTGQIVRDKMSLYPNLHLLRGKKEGLGWAYVRGHVHAMKVLHADAVIEMDADFQHDPIYIPGMVQQFQAGFDYVIGSRYTEGGGLPATWPWQRKAFSSLGNRLARFVLKTRGIHDLTTGFRLTRVKGILDQIELNKLMELNRFAFKLDLLYRTVCLSRRVCELPIQFKNRAAGETKFSLQEVMATLRVLAALRLKKPPQWTSHEEK
jgi:dolichol-phosphate mannosyltransferase